MNIDRGLAQLGVAASGDARAHGASKDTGDRPAFSLPAHDAPSPPDATQRPHAMQPRQAQAAGYASETRTAVHPRGADKASDASNPDDATAPAADGAKRRNAPNKAARGEAADARPNADTQEGDTATDGAAEPAPTNTSAPADTRRAAATDDEAALPDRMLALLSGAPLPGAPALPDTAPAAGLASGLTLTTAADATAASPTLSGLTPAAPGAIAPRGAGAAAPPAFASTDGASAAAALPASTSAPAPASDAFAALAALAGRTRDAAGSTTDSAPATATTGFAPLLARAADAVQTRAAATAVPAPLPLMLNADFDDGLGARVVWMAEQRIDHAQIRVSPEALGPIDVRLQLDGHRVNAQFHAANADVRQALETGMDRLRDMLGRQGMELGQAQVGSGSRHGGDGRAASRSADAHDGQTGDNGAEPASMRVAIPRSRGLLDEYA